MINIPFGSFRMKRWRTAWKKRILSLAVLAVIIIDVSSIAQMSTQQWMYIEDAKRQAIALEQCWRQPSDKQCLPLVAHSLEFHQLDQMMQMALITNAMLESIALSSKNQQLQQRLIEWVRINKFLGAANLNDLSSDELRSKLKVAFYTRYNIFLGKDAAK